MLCYFLMFLAAQSVTKSVRLFVTPWTTACQAPLFMGICRQKYWNGLPFASPGYFPDPWIEPVSPALAGRFFTVWATREALKESESESHFSRVRLFGTLWTIARQAPLSMGFSTGVGCHFLLQGILPNQRLNLGLPHCGQILYHLSHWISHTYTCVSSFLDFLPIQASSEHWVEFPALRSWFSLVIWSMQSTACESIPVSLFTPPPLSLVSICLFCTSASLFLCFVVQTKLNYRRITSIWQALIKYLLNK